MHGDGAGESGVEGEVDDAVRGETSSAVSGDDHFRGQPKRARKSWIVYDSEDEEA